MKRCWCCGLSKEESEFAKDRSRRDGLRSLCRQCDAIRYKARLPKPINTVPKKKADKYLLLYKEWNKLTKINKRLAESNDRDVLSAMLGMALYCMYSPAAEIKKTIYMMHFYFHKYGNYKGMYKHYKMPGRESEVLFKELAAEGKLLYVKKNKRCSYYR